jgi:exopolyphosphatase/guanosine-5'-triphosphate,3'-diphosphate pyrophosphatase
MLAEIDNGEYTILSKEKTTVKIGEGGIEKRIITEEASRRALNCIQSFSDKIQTSNIENVYAYATSAFRNATNGTELRDRIADKTGIHIQIIPGDEEARLIYDGVRLALNMGEETALVMDIGGGSVEFIIGNHKEIKWKQSFEIGAQRLLDRFYHSDPISQDSIQDLMNYLNEYLLPLKTAMTEYTPYILVGASGTFDTLSAIYCLQEGIHTSREDPEQPLTLSGFERIYSDIISFTREERLNIPGMVDMRVDMIVVASCLIEFVLRNFSIQQIRVSQFALKEGVLAQLINS